MHPPELCSAKKPGRFFKRLFTFLNVFMDWQHSAEQLAKQSKSQQSVNFGSSYRATLKVWLDRLMSQVVSPRQVNKWVWICQFIYTAERPQRQMSGSCCCIAVFVIIKAKINTLHSHFLVLALLWQMSSFVDNNSSLYHGVLILWNICTEIIDGQWTRIHLKEG